MKRNFGGKITMCAALAGFACLAAQAVAIASTSAASPYSILVPISASNAPVHDDGAVYKRRESPCSWGERDVPTDFGWRCVPAW
jgi:hypothetical protein